MKRTRHFFAMLYASVALIVFALGSCSRERSFESDEGKVTVKGEGEKIRVTSDEGTITMSGDEGEGQISVKTADGETFKLSYGKDSLPEAFPKDIPVYSPAAVKMSQTIDDSKSVVSFSTADDPSQVTAFYKKELPAKGWKVENEMIMGTMTLLHVQKGERELNVTVNKSDAETIISLVVGPAE